MRKTFYSKAFEVLADGFADDSNSDPMFTGTLYTQDVAVSVCGSKNYCDLVAERKMDLSRLETVLEN
ncbi:hypothetical protein EHQ27_14795 [Leptospira wolffii]|uniref:hypothetical protein n=1 Tax=Leptospira wolffii TaxID=409998 RepID=UPI0010838664|nr:hypothetical protein [Leptospira wolffii]TGK62263.1 hypothetical protein EHQ32_05405 [Leptospira wolffii]TGK68219.1 hypothetical protein EHQ27_14795 [Leptospira wolffii]TGK74353.1 hypothetical protein EHQ35_08370 [Leptospira wolffii]TGL32072.1 hypothetical protein EHQ57_04305 [Leptospira wolffii]